MCLGSSKKTPQTDPGGGWLLHFETDMCNAPCNNCPACCCACICAPCCACDTRKKALQGDYEKYQCCQHQVCGDKVEKVCGSCERSCPCCCMICESFCCLGLAVTGTKGYLQEERQLAVDPCDDRLICCSNVLMILACICRILSYCFESLSCVADLMEDAAYCFFCLIQACVTAQSRMELDLHPTAQDYARDNIPGPQAPEAPPAGIQNGHGRYVYIAPGKEKKAPGKRK